MVLVVFSDFECPNCKEEAKTLRERLPAAYPKDVRLYFKDFPLEQIHPWAKAAAMAGQCVFRENPAGFWQFHDWIYEHQAEITPDRAVTRRGLLFTTLMTPRLSCKSTKRKLVWR